jgi:hypothetical protein
MTNDEAKAKAKIDACAAAMRKVAEEHGMEAVSFGVSVSCDAGSTIACTAMSFGKANQIGEILVHQVEFYEARILRDGPMEHGERAAQA